MKILLIYTGGTIGSTTQNGFINTDPAQCSQLLSAYTDYESAFDLEPVVFTTDSPYVILSEELNISHILTLYQCIRQHLADNRHYDAILITHGTDTLHYTAAALCRLCPVASLPIVMVSANYVLDDPRSNGFANFASAVAFVRHMPQTGVYVSYQNNMSDDSIAPVYIYHANSLMPHTLYEDTVSSLHGQYVCRILPKKRDGQPYYEQTEQSLAYHSETNAVSENISLLQPRQPDILVLTVMPGMYYPPVTDDIRAILLLTYHSGTLPTKDSAFRDFAISAHKKEVPVYVLGTDPACTPYASTQAYTSLHLTLLPVMTPADAYMQLALGLL